MVKEWIKNIAEVSENTPGIGSPIASFAGAIGDKEGSIYTDLGEDDMTFWDMRKQPAGKFVRSFQRWCERWISETYSKNKAEILSKTGHSM